MYGFLQEWKNLNELLQFLKTLVEKRCVERAREFTTVLSSVWSKIPQEGALAKGVGRQQWDAERKTKEIGRKIFLAMPNIFL